MIERAFLKFLLGVVCLLAQFSFSSIVCLAGGHVLPTLFVKAPSLGKRGNCLSNIVLITFTTLCIINYKVFAIHFFFNLSFLLLINFSKLVILTILLSSTRWQVNFFQKYVIYQLQLYLNGLGSCSLIIMLQLFVKNYLLLEHFSLVSFLCKFVVQKL